MVKKETSFIDLKQVKIDDPFFSAGTECGNSHDASVSGTGASR